MKFEDITAGEEFEWGELETLYQSLDETKFLKDLSHSESSVSTYLKYGNTVWEFEETDKGQMAINKYVMEFL